MLVAEMNRVFVHVRWPVQSYVVAGFFFGLTISGVPLNGQIFLAFTAWLSLCAGLTVFNSYYDKDEEPVGGMAQPPKVASSLLYGSLILQVIGLAIAFFINNTLFFLSLLVAILYFFYSHKSFRLKSNGYVAVFLNSLLGFLTILAAASLGGNSSIAVILLGATMAAFFKASVYMMMQVHQIEADKIRGDISIAVMFGRKRTLIAALASILIAGTLGLATISLITEGLLLPILGIAYFILLAWFFLQWIEKEADPVEDFETMTRMIYLSGYLGSVLSIIFYILLNIM